MSNVAQSFPICPKFFPLPLFLIPVFQIEKARNYIYLKLYFDFCQFADSMKKLYFLLT